MSEERPNLLFAGLWVAWSVAVIVNVLVPDFWLTLAIIVYFLIVEIGGLIWNPPGLETLSHIVTWAKRQVGQSKAVLRSWNAALLAFVCCIAYDIGRWAFDQGVPWWFCVLISALIIMWLITHFLEPERD